MIHDLQRVNRVLNKHAGTSFLPEKHLLAKRLAQCLTSFLPSGVHLKALETYHIVFKRIGQTRLAADLPLYAGGLFPLLSYCSTSLKAPLLSLYEAHFLPLAESLRSVLDGLVLAILPGLEDETSEFYHRSCALLDSVADAVGDVAAFSRSVWRALLLCPPVRYAATHYLRSKLSVDDVSLRSHMVSDMPLVSYAITAALSDEDSFTQRNVLDLLVSHLALDSPFFHIERQDQRDAAVALVGGVFRTLLRKDISLTKRVHTWLLGGKLGNPAIEFCDKFSKHLVLAAVDKETDSALHLTPTDDLKVATRPCKISTALMDRSELCECLGHYVALRLLKYGCLALARDRPHAPEISNAVAEFLHDLGSARIFEELERILVSEKETSYEDFELLTFSLSMFPQKDQIVKKKHLPALLQVAVRSLNAVSADSLILDKAVGFCSKAILSISPIREGDTGETLEENIKKIVSVFASFFVAWMAHTVEPSSAELRREYKDVTVSVETTAELRMASTCEERKEVVLIAKSSCSFLATVAAVGIRDLNTLSIALHATAKCASAADARISLAGAKAFADISAHSDRTTVSAEKDEQALGVIRKCWRQMHPSLLTATAQSAQTLLALQRQYPEEVKVVISDGILSPIFSRRLRNLERFACLWRLAVEHRLSPLPADNGLLLMLDALIDDHWGPKMLSRSWLSDALEIDPASVLDAPLRLLLTPESRTIGQKNEFANVYDAPRALYAFQTLRSILESSPTVLGSTIDQGIVPLTITHLPKRGSNRGRVGVQALVAAAPSPRTVQALATVFAVESRTGSPQDVSSADFSEEGPVALTQLLPATNYVVAVGLTCLGYLRGVIPEHFRGEHEFTELDLSQSLRAESLADNICQSDENEDIQWTLAGVGPKSITELHESVSAAAAECLATLLMAIPVSSQMSSVVANLFAEPVLNMIYRSVGEADPVLELHFLNAMSFLVTADGPCYISSIQGREMFAKAKSGRRRISYSDNLSQAQVQRRGEQIRRDSQVGSAESLKSFIPWLLSGASSACLGGLSSHENGAQEVLGVRRRWIQFIDTVMKHVGVSLPAITEGLLLIFCELLKTHNAKIPTAPSSKECEFSRVDETLVLLEGLAVVSCNVLWSFEHALFGNALKDGAQSRVMEESAESLPHTLPSQSKDATSVMKSDSTNGCDEGIGKSSQIQSGPVPPLGSNPVLERANSVTNATTAVISALNPLRMINDFVKDVIIGSGADPTSRLLDPRRSGARTLFCLLPNIVFNIANVWGPPTEVLSEEENDSLSPERIGPPRLSTDLPRERRQVQRAAVLSILEPIFELRPVDTVASIITLFYNEQDEFGAMSNIKEDKGVARMACHMLHAIDFATPDVVVNCVKIIFEKAAKWDPESVEALEGRAQALLRQRASSTIQKLISSSSPLTSQVDVSNIGKMASNDHASPLPGGSTPIDLSQGLSLSGHQELYHWGDFFAGYSPGLIETACFNFLEHFFATSSDGDDTNGSWSILYPLLRDSVLAVRRKGTIPAIMRVLGVFVSKSPLPYPDRRARREIVSCASATINSCALIAGGQTDIPNEEHGNAPLFKKKLAIIALRTLSFSVPLVINSAFSEEKPQITTSAGACIVPAVATLKKAASRDVAITVAANSSKKSQMSNGSLSQYESETAVDMSACEASTDIISNIGTHDWGIKLVRSKLLSLLEDPNVFFGKNQSVLQKMSIIVKDVVANGGAMYLLSSIGTLSSNSQSGIPGIFIGRDSEAVLRARAIRRMAYIVFVSDPDYYSQHLHFILEKVRDVLRMSDSTLVGECLFCLRALLLRTGPSSISAFRATILSEIFHILNRPTEDLNTTLSVLRFLDVVTMLSPPDYGYERCFFFNDGTGEVAERALDGSKEPLKRFVPLVEKVSHLWTSDNRAFDEIFKSPLRLEAGKPVLSGGAVHDVDVEFIGRYATGLTVRDSLPKMKAAEADRICICNEFELEFLQGAVNQ